MRPTVTGFFNSPDEGKGMARDFRVPCAFVALSDSVVTNNSTGLQVQSGGKINSAGNNLITLNNVDGVPTAKIALK